MRSAQHSPQAINDIDWIALQHSHRVHRVAGKGGSSYISAPFWAYASIKSSSYALSALLRLPLAVK